MQKKVMIYAYANFNLGDDLFIKILCERYPETQFLLYAPSKYRHSLRELRNISIFPSNNLFKRTINFLMRLLKVDYSFRKSVAKKSDAIVHIGGSIFMQKDNWTGLKSVKKEILEKPHYILGANFGPYQSEQYYTDHYNLFKNYTDVCFRDTYSYELFKDLDNVRMANDIVFQLDNKKLIISDKSIVISVIKPSYRENLQSYDNVYYQKIKDIVLLFSGKGYKVRLMSFCEKEGDQEAIEKIIQLLPEKNMKYVSTYFYKYNIDEALEVIASSSFMIATRFHAMILGWVFKKPVFPIAYSEKMNNAMDNINYKGSFINLKEIDHLKSIEVYESMKTNFIDVSDQAKDAEKHFDKLDEYLLPQD